MIFMEKDKKINLLTLALQVTRRCNLKCNFCGKGEPQNIDITTEIIDKTFDEIQHYYISDLRLNGGETFLNPEIIMYILEQIEKRNIMVNRIFVFTNGYFFDDRIVKAIKRFCNYSRKIKTQIIDYFKDMERRTGTKIQNTYSDTANKSVAIIVSTYAHSNQHIINQTIQQFQNSIDDELFIIQRQSLTYDINNKKGHIELEGRAEKNYMNYKTLIEKSKVNIIENHYNFIHDINDDCIVIGKTIEISANGNVWLGSISSYQHTDEYAICNIMNCNNDLYERLSNWCWENPDSVEVNKVYKMYLTNQFLKAHNIDIRKETAYIDELLNVENCVKIYRNIHKTLHIHLPYLKHKEIEKMAILGLYLTFLKINNNPLEKEIFLTSFTDYNNKSIKKLLSNNALQFINQEYKYYETINMNRKNSNNKISQSNNYWQTLNAMLYILK